MQRGEGAEEEVGGWQSWRLAWGRVALEGHSSDKGPPSSSPQALWVCWPMSEGRARMDPGCAGHRVPAKVAAFCAHGRVSPTNSCYHRRHSVATGRGVRGHTLRDRDTCCIQRPLAVVRMLLGLARGSFGSAYISVSGQNPLRSGLGSPAQVTGLF